MTTIVELGENDSAAPGQCGSCHFFKRPLEKTGWCGTCTIKLPPWAQNKCLTATEDGARTERGLSSNRSCDLYRPATDAEGRLIEFRKVRTWRAGE